MSLENSPTSVMAERCAQCRADKVDLTRIGTFACRTFHRDTKASKSQPYNPLVPLRQNCKLKIERQLKKTFGCLST
jgi:hypothetical protein